LFFMQKMALKSLQTKDLCEQARTSNPKVAGSSPAGRVCNTMIGK
jgi:hypothetical protein